MYPVGFYDLRDAAPAPSPLSRPRSGRSTADELAAQPVPGVHLDARHRRRALLRPRLRGRVERSWRRGSCSPPRARRGRRRIAAASGRSPSAPSSSSTAAVAAFALSREPIDRAGTSELTAVSAVAADIGGVTTTHINHLTPRVLDIDELYRRMTAARHRDDRRDPGPAAVERSRRAAAADVLPGARRAARASASPTAASPRARCGSGSARSRPAASPSPPRAGDSTTRRWRPGPGQGVGRLLPRHPRRMASAGLAYYHGGDPRTRCLRGLPARSAAGIFRSNLDPTPRRPPTRTDRDSATTRGLDVRRDRPPHSDPYDLYEKAHHHDQRCRHPSLPPPRTCAPASATRCGPSARASSWVSPGAHGLHASTPITGDVLFTLRRDHAASRPTPRLPKRRRRSRRGARPRRRCAARWSAARRAAARAQGRPRPTLVTHRGRQDPLRGARRGAGDDRHLRLRGRPVPPALRPHHRLRAARATG